MIPAIKSKVVNFVRRRFNSPSQEVDQIVMSSVADPELSLSDLNTMESVRTARATQHQAPGPSIATVNQLEVANLAMNKVQEVMDKIRHDIRTKGEVVNVNIGECIRTLSRQVANLLNHNKVVIQDIDQLGTNLEELSTAIRKLGQLYSSPKDKERFRNATAAMANELNLTWQGSRIGLGHPIDQFGKNGPKLTAHVHKVTEKLSNGSCDPTKKNGLDVLRREVIKLSTVAADGSSTRDIREMMSMEKSIRPLMRTMTEYTMEHENSETAVMDVFDQRMKAGIDNAKRSSEDKISEDGLNKGSMNKYFHISEMKEVMNKNLMNQNAAFSTWLAICLCILLGAIVG